MVGSPVGEGVDGKEIYVGISDNLHEVKYRMNFNLAELIEFYIGGIKTIIEIKFVCQKKIIINFHQNNYCNFYLLERVGLLLA